MANATERQATRGALENEILKVLSPGEDRTHSQIIEAVAATVGVGPFVNLSSQVACVLHRLESEDVIFRWRDRYTDPMQYRLKHLGRGGE